MMKRTKTNTHVAIQQTAKAKRIKLGIDVHADSYRGVRQVDNATPQPAQRFTPEEFLAWAQLQQEISSELIAILEVTRKLLLAVHTEAVVATRALEKAAKPQAAGVGALSSQVLEREILDWNRFTNRRQVASLTGLCPGVRQSGKSSRSGSITRHGNRRIRSTLIEMAWRCRIFQRDYPPLRQRLGVLDNPKVVSGSCTKPSVHLTVPIGARGKSRGRGTRPAEHRQHKPGDPEGCGIFLASGLPFGS